MGHYLIELRFLGKAKWEMKQLIWEVNRRFHVSQEHRPVPHVTLAGPFTTNNTGRLVSDFKALCEKQDLMKFTVEGFGTFEDNGVVFINIIPDSKLDAFRWELSNTLQPYCNLKQYDYERKFEYHSTIAMKLRGHKFDAIKSYINEKPKPNFNHFLMRVTLIRDQKIMYEYDFLLKRLLTRYEAKNRFVLAQSYDQLKRLLGSEEAGPKSEEDSSSEPNGWGCVLREKKEDIEPKQTAELNLDEYLKKDAGWLNRLFSKPKVYCISDLHLDHTNIIRFCKRPFETTAEMNKALIDNWNKTIKFNDVVLFLGDLAYGRGSKSTDYWLSKLNGTVIFIKGNHDQSRKTKIYDWLIVNYKGRKFYLTHDPKDVPKDWNDWTICGHHHNNKPEEFPLINNEKKLINVGVELIDYKPILLDELIKRMK